jgi:PTH1 family peptidyl-tRNA hydrolase
VKLIIGLGNIGAEYLNTRHNLGFRCLDRWAAIHKKKFAHDKLFSYLKLSETVMIKPSTFMNRSGMALREALRRWTFDDILVVYDDIELPAADLRIRNGGGDGGHNGVKSLLQVTSPEELKRIRIGIGRPEGLDVTDYVLEAIPASQSEELDRAINLVAGFLDIFAKTNFIVLLNEYSKWKKSYSEVSASES